MHQLYTKWGRALDPRNILPEYPRPQMVRGGYRSLNGAWSYAIGRAGKLGRIPSCFDGIIQVPFSPESALSGVGRQLGPDEVLWYDRTFSLGEIHGRILLHFGAVDQTADVLVNGHPAVSHTGGYLPFSCEITGLVHPGRNEIAVRVTDRSDTSYHARGKQKLERGRMFYTATSGIWQSVWLEEVPDRYITSLDIRPDFDTSVLHLCVHTNGEEKGSAFVTVYVPAIYEKENSPGMTLTSVTVPVNRMAKIPIPEKKAWTPDAPYLYYFDVQMGEDTVRSYFALRTFTVEKRSENGREIPRLCLNHEVLFQKGVLDQGYWPDGILTAPSDEAMIFDLTEMKKTGFNMVRKHLKIEPERWYYHCDRLGLIVWQDMVNGGGKYRHWMVTYLATPVSLLGLPTTDRVHFLLARSSKEGRQEYVRELGETIRLLRNHPSICTWVLFNEGWGQFDTNEMVRRARVLDPTRLVDEASGWYDQRGGDFVSIHNYFFPLFVHPEKERANVLTEFGGAVWYVPGHSFGKKVYGYGVCESREALNRTYRQKNSEMTALIPKGLCGSVYTQWTDVEDEVNGIFTYDRAVRKIDG